MNLTDIHCHIIPGVDDGSKDMETSRRMLDIAYSDGIRRIILTPHNKPGRHNCKKENIELVCNDLQAYCDEQGYEITLYCGNEIMFRHELPECIENAKAITMCESQYVLVEFSPMDDYKYIRDGLYEVLAGGYTPIIAHAERYLCLTRDISLIEELHEMGILIQINADSLMGEFGHSLKKFCKSLMKEHLVSFIASDAHDTKRRVPKLNNCAKYVEKKYGAQYANKVFETNPTSIIMNYEI